MHGARVIVRSFARLSEHSICNPLEAMRAQTHEFPIRQVRVQVFQVPTDAPEADGTIEWSKTTLVVVEIEAGAERGLGYTYASKASAEVISDPLSQAILGKSAFDLTASWMAMIRSVRNLGRPGA